MRVLRPLPLWITLVVVAVVAPIVRAALPEIPPRPKAANDTTEYRRLVLDNGLKVLLVSDPKFNKSAAALAVGVGSLSDPKERQGLAHFLEHMLFLGTEKYPDESEYGNFLKINGGYSNAFTAGDHTNYHFEIRHEAFEGALDRFSQFFIAPLFTSEFTDREMNAVNSENQKNLENDLWRAMQLGISLYRPDHPANHFGTGNRATLGGTTREELLKFYNDHYSADRMALALTGSAGLDQLEAWARTYFSPVKRHDLPAIKFPPDFIVPKNALRLARMEPLKDLRQLMFEFSLPETRSMWAGKSDRLIGFVLGYEGEGSLLSQLKAEGLATGLGAGPQSETPDYGSFGVNVTLTPEGEKNTRRVLELFFSAVEDMRREGFPSELFAERAAMASLDEAFADKGEGASRALALADQMLSYPLEVAEREPYLWLTPDPEGYRVILDRLRPENMIALLIAKGVETDAVEPIYGTHYSYREEVGAPFDALKNPPKVAGIHVPKANPFVPKSTDLLSGPGETGDPALLVDEPTLSVYHLPDREFLRPMVSEVFRFRMPRTLGAVDTAVLLRFYEACVNESLNEIAYTAGEAGLHFQLSAALEGVVIAIDGYNEPAPRLLDEVAKRLVDFQLSEERFAALKDRILRDLSNFQRADAWQYLLEVRRAAIREFHYRPDEMLPVAKDMTLARVKSFARALYARGKLESLVHGNITASDAEGAARQLAGVLKSTAVPDKNLLRRRLYVDKPGMELLTSEKLEVNNSAYRQEYVLGEATPEMRAVTRVFANLIGEPYYGEMRTRQQLGYVVFGGAGEEEKTCFAYFIIQSGEHPADDLRAKSEAFIAEIPGMLDGLDDGTWSMLVGAVRDELHEKDKSISERAARLFPLAYDYDRDWSRREETVAALEVLTKERFIEIVRTTFAADTRRVRTFLGFARQHDIPAGITPSFTDRDAWKAKNTFE